MSTLRKISPEAKRVLDAFQHARPLQHPKQAEAFNAVCEGLDHARDAAENGTDSQIVTLYGPPGAGKTTLVRLVQDAAKKAFLSEEHDADDIPYIYVHAPQPNPRGSLQLSLFFMETLASIGEKHLDRKRIVPAATAGPRDRRTGNALQLACEEMVRRRRPIVFCIDEAQHLGLHSSQSQMHTHLDFVKTFADTTRVPILLVGQYSLVEFGVLSGQLGRRTIDVPLHRYGMGAEDQRMWAGIVKYFGEQLPTAEKLDLVGQSDFLYERSVGCVGILKPWLNRALRRALVDERKVVTLKDLEATAQPMRKVNAQRTDAEQGEARLRELDAEKEQVDEAVVTTPAVATPRKPGERALGRDAVGEGLREVAA